MQSESIETEANQKVHDQNKFYLGCVKWFNNKKGYGYVTIKEGELKSQDILLITLLLMFLKESIAILLLVNIFTFR